MPAHTIQPTHGNREVDKGDGTEVEGCEAASRVCVDQESRSDGRGRDESVVHRARVLRWGNEGHSVLAGDAECGDEKSDEESDFLDPSLLMNFCNRKGSFRLSDFPARRGVPHRVPPHRDTTATVRLPAGISLTSGTHGRPRESSRRGWPLHAAASLTLVAKVA
jgi:hypothetical protein